VLICTTTQPHRLLPAGAHHLAAVPARPGAAQRSAAVGLCFYNRGNFAYSLYFFFDLLEMYLLE